MPDNRISATLSQADQQAVLAAVNTIRTKLPFLVDLTSEERRTLLRMGDKSRGFVAQALTVAEQNEGILPRSFDVTEMRKDVDLLAALEPIMASLSQTGRRHLHGGRQRSLRLGAARLPVRARRRQGGRPRQRPRRPRPALRAQVAQRPRRRADARQALNSDARPPPGRPFPRRLTPRPFRLSREPRGL